jgi:hypothetical protein
MNFGFPQDLTLYKLFTDWGSLFAGLIAFVAGAIAYLAGVYQARATREAANLQIAAMNQQKNEEIAQVSDAVRTEVTAFAKYVIGAVEICQQIRNGLKIPIQSARYVAKSFWGDPIVYPAVADRVGLLPHPHATTEFYMRLSEVRAMLEALRTKTDPSSHMYVSPPPEFVTPDFAATIADSLITALQLARPIVSNDGNPSAKSQLAALVQTTVVGQIDECLASARAFFPDAESFQAGTSK